jgi:hypothetical protein
VVWEAFVEETKVVRVAVNWFMGEENLDPPQHAQNEMRTQKPPQRYVEPWLLRLPPVPPLRGRWDRG